MISADLGECEWFVRDLQNSNLVERGQIDQLVGDFLRQIPRGEPAQLADYLVKERVLTQFQADSLLQGKKDMLVLGPYCITEMIGFGSMGTVYKGQSKVDKQWYAVKVLPNRGVLKLRNAKQIARDFKQIKHSSVVPFADAGAGGSTNFLAWPFIEGGVTLQKIVEQRGRLTPGLSAHYATQVSEGLAMCHEKGISHGLLKPSNLMVKSDHTILILDLGMGTLVGQEESVIHTGGLANLAASADCSAPETANDPTAFGPAGDQYALGCILYYCLTGGYPFEGADYVTKIMAHVMKPLPPVKDKAPDTPDGVVTVLEKMLAKKPADRYESMFHVVAALRPFAKTEATPAFDGRAAEAPAPAKPEPPRPKPAAAKAPPVPPTVPPAEPQPAQPPVDRRPPPGREILEQQPAARPPWMEPGAEADKTDKTWPEPVPDGAKKGNALQTLGIILIIVIVSAVLGAAAVMLFK